MAASPYGAQAQATGARDLLARRVPRRAEASAGDSSERTIWLLAIYNVLLGGALLILAVVVLRLIGADVGEVLRDWTLRLHLDPQSPFALAMARRLSAMDPRLIGLVGVLTTLYGSIRLLQGLGLWFKKRWAEYMYALSTGVFIPVELYEVVGEFHLVGLAAFFVNVALVAYLVHRIRRRRAHATAW